MKSGPRSELKFKNEWKHRFVFKKCRQHSHNAFKYDIIEMYQNLKQNSAVFENWIPVPKPSF